MNPKLAASLSIAMAMVAVGLVYAATEQPEPQVPASQYNELKQDYETLKAKTHEVLLAYNDLYASKYAHCPGDFINSKWRNTDGSGQASVGPGGNQPAEDRSPDPAGD